MTGAELVVVSLVVYVVYTLLGTGVYRLLVSVGIWKTSDPDAALVVIVFWPLFLIYAVFAKK